MPVYTQEDKIILAIEAIRSARVAGQKLSVLRAAKTYGVPESSVRHRMNDRPRREHTQPERRFPLRLAGVEDMANLLLRARNGEPFALLHNMMAKYGIGEGDIYNFDETGFMIGVITALIVMLVIDGHESYLLAEFDDYCKQNAIITISMPPHLSHLLQLLDIALYSPLKRVYGDEINLFIQASINHII
ncbi:hypothetical protein K456DRAFT_53790, partial [Colletotrichum gloeosporioides 23]